MGKTIWTGTCSAIIGVATIAITAQTGSPPQSSGPQSDRRITVTGCLKAAPSTSADTTAAAGTAGTAGAAGATGMTGTAGAAASSDAAGAGGKFLLTNATVSSADTGAAGSTAAASTAGGPSTSASAQTYRLVANPVALSPHVGKKLELTGTLEDQNSSTSSASSDS